MNTIFDASLIVNTKAQTDYLLSLLRNHGNKATLLYRASRDGWGGDSFHTKCDNRGATVTLFLTSTGRVCGGFVSVSWDRKVFYKSDDKSFLFSLNLQRVFPVQDTSKAIISDGNFGPEFGIVDLNCISEEQC